MYKVFVLILVFLGGAVSSFLLLNQENIDNDLALGQVVVTASGAAEWFYEDHEHLPEETFGTPEDPKAENLIPLKNREVASDDPNKFVIKKFDAFSRNREDISGKIKITAIDRTAIDSPDSKDEATVEAEFIGPEGNTFRVVLKNLMLGKFNDTQTFGGVAQNMLTNEGTPTGIDLLPKELAYLMVFGTGDVYKNDKLIDSDTLVYASATERAHLDEWKTGDKKPTDLDNVIIHLVLRGAKISPVTQKLEYSDIPTGFFYPDGSEQTFLHINFYDNIEITGNQFF